MPALNQIRQTAIFDSLGLKAKNIGIRLMRCMSWCQMTRELRKNRVARDEQRPRRGKHVE